MSKLGRFVATVLQLLLREATEIRGDLDILGVGYNFTFLHDFYIYNLPRN
jgi:hypothetical protein